MTDNRSHLFQSALKHTLTFEGGYANDPEDAGGETFRGISRKNWPAWPGWPLIDNVKQTVSTKALIIDIHFDGDVPMADLVADFYFQNFWLPFARLGWPQRLTAKLFDTSVNLGLKGAVVVLQRALNRTDLIAPLAEDGRIGPRTKAALDLALEPPNGEARLLRLLVEKQSEYYQSIVIRKPSQNKFLNGWLRRAAWVPE